MRLPTSYGSVYKLSGKRRRPYCVRVTTGWSDEGKQQRSILGYYTSKAEALQVLADFNANPYSPGGAFVTFRSCYEKWSAEHFPVVSDSNVKGYKAAFSLCAPFVDSPIKDIKLQDIQLAADSSGKNKPTLRKYKVLLGLVFDWAVKNEVITKDRRDIVSYLDLSRYDNPNKLNRSPFSKSEVELLWSSVDRSPFVSVVLMLIYSGLRISELLDLRSDDVHLDDHCFFIRSSKTAAGVRWVPIADKVYPFWCSWFSSDSEYLIHTDSMPHFLYRNFKDAYWSALMDSLGFSHGIHDTRHTFVSLMTEVGTDPRVLKQIVGHSGQNVTEAVYTHLDMDYKLSCVNKL